MTTLRRTLPLAVAAVLLAVGLVGWWMWFDLRGDDASDNRAVIDAKQTAQVQAES
jgi:Mce-associated membrane protein